MMFRPWIVEPILWTQQAVEPVPALSIPPSGSLPPPVEAKVDRDDPRPL